MKSITNIYYDFTKLLEFLKTSGRNFIKNNEMKIGFFDGETGYKYENWLTGYAPNSSIGYRQVFNINKNELVGNIVSINIKYRLLSSYVARIYLKINGVELKYDDILLQVNNIDGVYYYNNSYKFDISKISVNSNSIEVVLGTDRQFTSIDMLIGEYNWNIISHFYLSDKLTYINGTWFFGNDELLLNDNREIINNKTFTNIIFNGNISVKDTFVKDDKSISDSKTIRNNINIVDNYSIYNGIPNNYMVIEDSIIKEETDNSSEL